MLFLCGVTMVLGDNLNKARKCTLSQWWKPQKVILETEGWEWLPRGSPSRSRETLHICLLHPSQHMYFKSMPLSPTPALSIRRDDLPEGNSKNLWGIHPDGSKTPLADEATECLNDTQQNAAFNSINKRNAFENLVSWSLKRNNAKIFHLLFKKDSVRFVANRNDSLKHLAWINPFLSTTRWHLTALSLDLRS